MQQQVLDERIALISVSSSIFGGYRRATKEMIRELGGVLPESKAVTQGSIKVFPGEALAPLGTLRRSVYRILSSKGIKALGSRSVFAIPADARAEMEAVLEKTEQEFLCEVASLAQSFDAMFEAYVKEAPEAEVLLRRLAVDKSSAVAKCTFSWTPFQITPLARNGQDQEKGVETVLKSLGGQLLEEVAGEFEDMLKNPGFISGKVGQKFMRPIRAQVAKMTGLAFLEETVPGAIQLVTDTLALLPRDGYIEGEAFKPLQKLVEVCADVETLIDSACRIKNGLSIQNVLFPPAPVLVAPVPEPVIVMVKQPMAIPVPKVVAVLNTRPTPVVRPMPIPVSVYQSSKETPVQEVAIQIPTPALVRPRARTLMF